MLHRNWKFLLHLIFWSLIAGLAIGLNPNGISIWRLPFTTANVSMQIQEWASPDFHQMEFQPLLWMLFLLIIYRCSRETKNELDIAVQNHRVRLSHIRL